MTVPVPADLVVRDPDKLRWGTVSTIRAPLRDIARFAAYHLDLGAAEVNIFLDVPDQTTADFFAGHSAVKIVQCTLKYWAGRASKLNDSHQLRQAFNATRCYRRTRVHWLAHIDVDEFLLSPDPIAQLLAATPPDAAFARLYPAEMLAQPDPWQGPVHFKLTRKELGLSNAVLEDIYPEFGRFVPEGFLSYTGGKNFARTGLADIRFGLHQLSHSGARVSNGQTLRSAHVGHAHAPSWEVFNHHLKFRLEKGSYRRKSGETMKLSDVLNVIHEQEGGAGIRRFFAQMCEATPQLTSSLARFGMLLTARLDLDQKVAHWFGDLPNSKAGT